MLSNLLFLAILCVSLDPNAPRLEPNVPISEPNIVTPEPDTSLPEPAYLPAPIARWTRVEAWQRLRPDMSPQNVKALLGEPVYQDIGSTGMVWYYQSPPSGPVGHDHDHLMQAVTVPGTVCFRGLRAARTQGGPVESASAARSGSEAASRQTAAESAEARRRADARRVAEASGRRTARRGRNAPGTTATQTPGGSEGEGSVAEPDGSGRTGGRSSQPPQRTGQMGGQTATGGDPRRSVGRDIAAPELAATARPAYRATTWLQPDWSQVPSPPPPAPGPALFAPSPFQRRLAAKWQTQALWDRLAPRLTERAVINLLGVPDRQELVSRPWHQAKLYTYGSGALEFSLGDGSLLWWRQPYWPQVSRELSAAAEKSLRPAENPLDAAP